MAEFCTNCGAQLSGTFCGRCGHRAQSASAPAQAPAPQPAVAPIAQPVAAAQPVASPQPAIAQQPITRQAAQPAAPAQPAQPPKSSGAGKALLIVGGIILVMVLGAFGAVFYGVHWVKGKVSSVTGGSFGSEVSQGNMCKLLSTGELQQMIRSEQRRVGK